MPDLSQLWMEPLLRQLTLNTSRILSLFIYFVQLTIISIVFIAFRDRTMKYIFILGILMTILLVGCAEIQSSPQSPLNQKEKTMDNTVVKSEKEWKEILTPEQYRILRKGGTERAFTGKYNTFFKDGFYLCAACQTPLFSSDTKFDHGCGWPSFNSPLETDTIEYIEDNSLGMRRIEVRCATCGSHLGHVFDDGPQPTGQRYCINSMAMEFTPELPKEEAVTVATATFAAGCFWGVEHKLSQITGVLSTRVGFTGGRTEDPTYKQVCSATTGHAEAVEIQFDPEVIGYEELLDYFFKFHDPTQIDRQGPDVGDQYRSAVFFHNEEQKNAAEQKIAELQESGRFEKPIATRVASASEFYKAEEYHQDYYDKLYKKKK